VRQKLGGPGNGMGGDAERISLSQVKAVAQKNLRGKDDGKGPKRR